MFQLEKDFVNCDISIIQNTMQKFKVKERCTNTGASTKALMLNRKKKGMLQNEAYNI